MTEDDRICELLREMRDDAVPPASLVRVRQAVERRTAERQSRWVWLLVAAVAALVLVWFARPVARVVGQPPLPVARIAPKPAVPTAAVAKPVQTVTRRKPARAVRRESMSIRIETADPDVVLLIVNGGAE